MQTQIRAVRMMNAFLVLAVVAYPFSAQASQRAITTFDPEGSTGTSVAAINQAGVIAGNFTDAIGQHGFLREPDGAITTFDPPGGSGTSVLAMNSVGAIVGTYVDSNGNAQLFLRAATGTFTTIELPGGIGFILGVAINAQDEITGTYFTNIDFTQAGFLRTSDGTVTTLSFQGGVVLPTALNDSGEIIGAAACIIVNFVQTCSGFLQTSTGAVTLFNPSGSTNTGAIAINPGGVIAGSYTDANNATHGFLRTANGTIRTFDPPGSAGTNVNVINPGAAIAGTYTDASSNPHGFVRAHQGTITTFDFPAGPPNTVSSFGSVAGINPEGMVAGIYGFLIMLSPGNYEFVTHGFALARGGTFTDVEPAGATGSAVVGITPAGVIAGSYVDSSSVQHGFVFRGDDD